jgi:hypothetical protein
MRKFSKAIFGAIVAAAFALTVQGAQATPLTVSATIGGVPTGVSYVNFNDLPAGSAGGSSAATGVGGSVTVAFTTDAQAVTGPLSGKYAPPWVYGNGGLFGDPTVNAADSTQYITSGENTGGPNGSVTITFPQAEEYVGLLWGSVDSYNALSFYDASNTLIATVTGSDVTASANGDQGANGTFYVNINSTVPFTHVIATSSKYAFEFDNLAYSPTRIPEPPTSALLGAALLGLGFLRFRRKRIA